MKAGFCVFFAGAADDDTATPDFEDDWDDNVAG